MEESSGLGDVPEECLALILASLSVADLDKLALVNKAFLGASRSDDAWKPRLPPHWQEVAPDHSGSAMDLYHKLCGGVFLENERKLCRVDRLSSGVCYMLSSRALQIAWGSDNRYWEWKPMTGSRFEEVAYLRAVCWLEIRGQFHGYLRPGSYTVSFRLRLLERQADRIGHERTAYGWSFKPVTFSVSAPPAVVQERRRYVTSASELQSSPQREIEVGNLAEARVVEDEKWMEYDAGEFTVDDDEFPVSVDFSMTETHGGHWKSGLFVDGAVIRPTFLVS